MSLKNKNILNHIITFIKHTKYTTSNKPFQNNTSKNKQKYLVMDIEKALNNYNSGNHIISSNTYSTLQTELTRIKNTIGENLD